MDLWIRSQDRNILCKAQTLKVCFNCFSEWCVFNESEELGKYESEERALQILDEIQKYVDEKPIIKIGRVCDYQEKIKEFGDGFVFTDARTEIVPAKTMLYQMPKE